MPHRQRLAALLLCSASALGLAPAFADDAAGGLGAAVTAGVGGSSADKPADESGARAIADFLAAYAGKASLPSVQIKQDGNGYRVSLDIASASVVAARAGVTYDPVTFDFHVFQQQDGRWRIALENPPPVSAHVNPPPDAKKAVKSDVKVDMPTLKVVTLLDPKLNWMSESHGGAEKISVVQRGPGFENATEFDNVKIDGKTVSGASGLTTTLHEPLGAMTLTLDTDPKGVDPATGGPAKPAHVSAQGENGAIDVSLNDFQPGPLLDVWRFLAAHQERADLARDAAALRTVAMAAIADRMTGEEKIALDKLDVLTPSGTVSIEGAAFHVGGANTSAGAGFSERFAARSIKLPDGLVPPMYAPLTPTSFDFGFKASGFDLDSAAQAYFDHAKFDGTGPTLSEADRALVRDKLTSTRPIAIDIEPSHIKGAGLDMAFEGKITVTQQQPSGQITITLHNFDQTAEAVAQLGGPQAAQMTPVIAMAKGLGKPGADGALVWVCAVGADRVIKVNGLPLGKAPF